MQLARKKYLGKNGSGSLRQSKTQEIIKGKPLKPEKQGLVTQIDFREMVALWWAVFFFVCCTGKRTHSAFYTYLAAFFSLQGMTFKAREDLEVTGLLLICFKPYFVLFCGFFTMFFASRQCSTHIKHSRKFLPLSWSKSTEVHPIDLTEIFTLVFNLQNPIAGGH